MRSTTWTGRVLRAARVDLGPTLRHPGAGRVAAATVTALAASLGADRLAVLGGTSLFPSTSGYAHFRFSDYATLTALGVVAAGIAWPIVTRISSQPRWLFLRLAVVVSAVLLLPDVWLVAEGQPARAVAVLAAMHLVIAVVTYNLLVHVAPAGQRRPAADGSTADPAGAGHEPAAGADTGSGRLGRTVWLAMAGLVGIETVLGVVALVVVPAGRPSGWLPSAGRDVYLAHAAVGAALGIGAVLVLVVEARGDRLARNSALVALLAVGLGAGGGVLAVSHPERLLGMGLMLVGAVVGSFAYLAPVALVEGEPQPPRSPSVAGRTGHGWSGAGQGELACPVCRALAAEARERVAADTGPEEWAASRIAAGTCPLCPDRRLRPFGGVLLCECCETVYRRLPGEGDDTAWAVTPGEQVVRSLDVAAPGET